MKSRFVNKPSILDTNVGTNVGTHVGKPGPRYPSHDTQEQTVNDMSFLKFLSDDELNTFVSRPYVAHVT